MSLHLVELEAFFMPSVTRNTTLREILLFPSIIGHPTLPGSYSRSIFRPIILLLTEISCSSDHRVSSCPDETSGVQQTKYAIWWRELWFDVFSVFSTRRQKYEACCLLTAHNISHVRQVLYIISIISVSGERLPSVLHCGCRQGQELSYPSPYWP